MSALGANESALFIDRSLSSVDITEQAEKKHPQAIEQTSLPANEEIGTHGYGAHTERERANSSERETSSSVHQAHPNHKSLVRQ
jgi:hypothetical protein